MNTGDEASTNTNGEGGGGVGGCEWALVAVINIINEFSYQKRRTDKCVVGGG
jgi:hypothetical protein